MTFTGRRSITNRTGKAHLLDWVIAIAMLPPIFYMLVSGNIVLTVFGVILAGFTITDTYHYIKKEYLLKKRLARHISRMMGSYIAAVTAFLVVNLQFEPAWVLWLLPTALLTPVLIYFIRKTEVRLKF